MLYGIITYGLILAAQATITQAAADGARAGIVMSSSAGYDRSALHDIGVYDERGTGRTDVGWMSNGTCGTTEHDALPASRQKNPARRTPNNECLTVTVVYNYASSPLFPEMPGLGIITPVDLCVDATPCSSPARARRCRT